MKILKKGGSRGRTPWAASPSGGERGSPSYLPQKFNQVIEEKRISIKDKMELFST